MRKDGRIAVQVYLGRVDGKRKYKTVYGSTQKEADEKALQIKLSMRKGLDVASEMDSFSEWAERWITIKTTEISNSQTVVYKCSIKHLNGYIGDRPISKIKPIDLQDIITKLAKRNPNTNKPMAKATLTMLKITATQIFELAIANRILEHNPASSIVVPTNAPKATRRALTTEEQEWILKVDHRAKRAAMLMMYAGLRKGELIPLTWSDINLNERTIMVEKSVETVNGKYIVKDQTKTKAGMRRIVIPQKLSTFLENEPHESEYVCVTAKNTMHTQSSFKRMWESYLLTLNLECGDFSALKEWPNSKFDPHGVPFVIPKFTPHWLRHTFATMLYFAGVDILTAKEQLGHSNINTTLGIYTHLDQYYKEKSMSKLDEYLKCKSSASQK